MQQIAHALRQGSQFDRPAGISRRRIQRHQGAQPAAIDVVHSSQVENNLIVQCEQILHRVSQAGRLLSKNQPAMAIHHGNSIHTAGAQLQLHKGLLATDTFLRILRVARLERLRKTRVALSTDSGSRSRVRYHV